MSAEDVRAEVLADELFRRKYGRSEVPESFDQARKGDLRTAAERVLASDWLAEYVATKQAEAARAAVRAIADELRESGAYSEHRMADWVELRVQRVADRIANPEASAT